MAILSKQQILAAQDVLFEDVPVPEWGGAVRIKGMSSRERDDYELASMSDLSGLDPNDKELLNKMKERMDNIRARLVAFTAVDEAGNLLFTEADLEALGRKSAAAMQRCYEAAQRLNGIGEKQQEALVKI